MDQSRGVLRACQPDVWEFGPSRAPRASDFAAGHGTFQLREPHEALKMRFRADYSTHFNGPQFGAPNAATSHSNFGVITTTIGNYAAGRGTPRELAAFRENRALVQ